MNQRGFINIVLVLVIVVIAGAVGYFALMRKPPPPTVQQTPAPTPTQVLETQQPTQVTQTPSSEIANWLVYQDNTHGFEVKYPAGYKLTKYTSCKTDSRDLSKPQNVILFFNEKYLGDFGSNDDIAKYGLIDFDIYVNDPNDECISSRYAQLVPSGVRPSDVKGYKLLGSENIKINDYKVLKRDYIDVAHPSETVYKFSTWRFEKDGSYYTLFYNNGQPIDPEKHKNLFLKFLATFRFTN